jgi:hypothetical protein
MRLGALAMGTRRKALQAHDCKLSILFTLLSADRGQGVCKLQEDHTLRGGEVGSNRTTQLELLRRHGECGPLEACTLLDLYQPRGEV